MLNALYFKRLFSEEELKYISEALEAYSFTLFSLSGEYASKTLEVSFKNRITIYDASYVALAIIRNTMLYTADEKLYKKLGKEHSRFVKTILTIK